MPQADRLIAVLLALSAMGAVWFGFVRADGSSPASGAIADRAQALGERIAQLDALDQRERERSEIDRNRRLNNLPVAADRPAVDLSEIEEERRAARAEWMKLVQGQSNRSMAALFRTLTLLLAAAWAVMRWLRRNILEEGPSEWKGSDIRLVLQPPNQPPGDEYARAYAALGLPIGTGWGDIESAYRERTKLFYAALTGDIPEPLKAVTRQKIDAVDEAYRRLKAHWGQ